MHSLIFFNRSPDISALWAMKRITPIQKMQIKNTGRRKWGEKEVKEEKRKNWMKPVKKIKKDEKKNNNKKDGKKNVRQRQKDEMLFGGVIPPNW